MFTLEVTRIVGLMLGGAICFAAGVAFSWKFRVKVEVTDE